MAGKTCRSSLCFPFRFANFLFLLRMINKTMPATTMKPPVIVNELLLASPPKKNMAPKERDRIPQYHPAIPWRRSFFWRRVQQDSGNNCSLKRLTYCFGKPCPGSLRNHFFRLDDEGIHLVEKAHLLMRLLPSLTDPFPSD